VTTGMEMAAMSRIDEPGERKPFYMFMDEFQDFSANEGAAKTLAQILSECRKFGLYLHLAHQTVGQLHSHQLSFGECRHTRCIFY
jgi:type IV secretory pathway TraG/TraD family ATPase VirD4